jgi:predicted RNA-binding Zn-ribbon protein involved in translation (DUF1610 family)
MDTICQSCGARIDIPYILLGSVFTCQDCGERTIPKAMAGARPADTGYEITFSDFHELLSYSGYRSSIAPLLREWYGYELEPLGDSVRVRAHDGNEVDELKLHQRIQSDKSKQSALYRAAMTLWR